MSEYSMEDFVEKDMPTNKKAIIDDENARKIFLKEFKKEWDEAKKIPFAHAGSLIAEDNLSKCLQFCSIYYINDLFDKAIVAAEKDNTVDQHTIPDTINKTFAKRATSNRFIVKGREHNVMSNAFYSMKKNESKTIAHPVLSKYISTIENFYDLTDAPSEIVKLIEKLLSLIENNAKDVIKKVQRTGLESFTLRDRVAIGFYLIAQYTRTGENQDFLNSFAESVKELTEEFEIDEETRMLTEPVEIGKYIFNLINNVELLNIFLCRKWVWHEMSHGTVFHLRGISAYHEHYSEYNEGSGLMTTGTFFLALDRNLVLETSINKDIEDQYRKATKEEEKLINKIIIFNSGRKNDVYYHPDDDPIAFSKFSWKQILKNLKKNNDKNIKMDAVIGGIPYRFRNFF